MTLQSPSKKAPRDLTQFSQRLFLCSKHSAKSFVGIAINFPICFPESHQQSEIPSLSKAIFVLGKPRSHRVPHLGCRGAESPGSSWQAPPLHIILKSHEEKSCQMAMERAHPSTAEAGQKTQPVQARSGFYRW